MWEDAMKNKIFYKQVNFYLMAFALAFAVVALGLYAGKCASEFNGGVVSSQVVAGDIVAIFFGALAVAGSIVEHLLAGKPVLSAIVKYKRFCLYIAFIALIYSFAMGILAEYSLIGTVLYPIVSGTAGDPVDPVLLGCYIAQLLGTLAALVCAIVAALLQKSHSYQDEEAAKYQSMKAGA